MTRKNKKTFLITVRLTFRGIHFKQLKTVIKGQTKLLDELFSLPPEDPFEEIEGSIEIS